jgi:UDP-3-O-[3-hydroxymyristoyl] glucosamine N-acyltransferase
MEHPGFFRRAGPYSLADIAKATNSELAPEVAADTMIEDVRTLTDAGPRHLTFFNNRKYLERLKETRAGAASWCRIRLARAGCNRDAGDAGGYQGFALALRLFYGIAAFASNPRWQAGPNRRSAELGTAWSGQQSSDPARIGRGTRIAARAVVGYRVAIGRDCYIGRNPPSPALVGDGDPHAGARVGRTGSGLP